MAAAQALDRAALCNSVNKMRKTLYKPDLSLSIPASVRKNLTRPELRELFEKLDPDAKGVVSLGALRREMGVDDSPAASPERGKRLNTRHSHSLPVILNQGRSPEKKRAVSPGMATRLIDAFKGAGEDDYRDRLLAALEKKFGKLQTKQGSLECIGVMHE